uniref:Neurotensin/neuromedin N n=1 Tax=Leptobrachium leishanense TaxID=445787 RepID=A0A8C5QLH9_9ANUR
MGRTNASVRVSVMCIQNGEFRDSEEEMKALEADVLSNMYSSKVNKARLPYWKMTLLNVCNLISNLNNEAEETGETGDDNILVRKQFPTSTDGFNMEAMLTLFQLQKMCQNRVFQHWEVLQQDYLDPNSEASDKEEIVKRKVPYILKRQTHVSKARRPYILKRGSYY